jgi:vacuolar-type H+-ATPase subunit I/STV1
MLKKLKSLFIVEDEAPSVDGKVSEDKSSKIETAPEPNTSEELADIPERITHVPPGSKPDSKFINVLLKAIDANNLEGFDYLEYKQSLQSLAKMDMDEATRYQSAFAMAKTMGASPKTLIESAHHYIKVLASEDKKFKGALANQRGRQVEGREEKLKVLQNSIEQKKKQIEKLNKDIEKEQQKLGEIRNSIKDASAKIELTNSQFQLAYKSVLAQIEQDINKMSTYLK